MPEQFALQQVFAQGIAIHRHKGLVFAQTVVVDGTRDHFLAGTTLPGDQDRGVGRCALGNQRVHRLHRRAGTDDILKPVLGANFVLEVPIFLQQTPALQGPVDNMLEFIRIKRLGQIIKGAEFHRLDRRLDLRQPCHHDHIHIGMTLLDLLQYLQTVDARHHDVEHHQVEFTLLDFAQGRRAVLGRINAVQLAVAQNASAAPDHNLLVINDQDSCTHGLLSSAWRSVSLDGGMIGR